MFHLCENCPDITNLSNYLKNIFEDNDFDDDDKINYKQWAATDCTTLACIQSTVDEFFQTATEMMYDKLLTYEIQKKILTTKPVLF